MTIEKINSREAVTLVQTATLPEAIELMKQQNIGDVVIVNSEDQGTPIGMLTDRDIALSLTKQEVDLQNTKVCDVMNTHLLVLNKNMGIKEAIEKMQEKGVRRAPLVDDKVCGIAAVDDLLVLIADELSSLAKLISKQTQCLP